MPEISEINLFYQAADHCCLVDGEEKPVKFGKRFDSLVEEALNNVYENRGGKGKISIDPALFSLNNEPLQKGVSATFGQMGVEFGKRNEGFISQFKHNTAVFAAFKSHSEKETLSKLILNENGDLRSFHEFQKAAMPVIGMYNRQWLAAEYNTVVRSARMAANWQKFQEKKHIFPNVEFMESTSLHKREEHLQFVGTILPIDDAWWNTHTPPLSWGCKCWIRQTRADSTDEPDDNIEPNPVFADNPGKTASPFNIMEHPYAKNTGSEVKKAAEKVAEKSETGLQRDRAMEEMLPLLDRKIEKQARDEIITVGFTTQGNRHLFDDTLWRSKGVLLKEDLKDIDKALQAADFAGAAINDKKKKTKNKRKGEIVKFYYFKDKNKELYYNVAKRVYGDKNEHVEYFLYSATKKIRGDVLGSLRPASYTPLI